MIIFFPHFSVRRFSFLYLFEKCYGSRNGARMCVILIWVFTIYGFVWWCLFARYTIYEYCFTVMRFFGEGDEKRFSSFRWVGVCGGVFRKTGDIHNMAETIFYATFLLFHFYMLCLIASLTVDYCCLICVVLFVCV